MWSIPTQVGVIPARLLYRHKFAGIPHASGGDPDQTKATLKRIKYSPRKWG
ncbi:hypothetical protein ACADC178_0814 [Lactobacillus delbrueckii subsp. lactis]|nr:hypothetical protein ACADC178_0814 [Lactobacillus delbrueckii subsp. lactis]